MAFFRKFNSFFQISESPKENIPKTILNLKFKIPAQNILLFWAGILNFKFRIVFLEYFLGDLEIWKTNSSFWKKNTFNSPVLFHKKSPSHDFITRTLFSNPCTCSPVHLLRAKPPIRGLSLFFVVRVDFIFCFRCLLTFISITAMHNLHILSSTKL